MEPQKINVIVYCARNLKPKKGADVACKPHVVFGIGKEKFRTECATGTNPTWNEESPIQVTKPAPLVFTVVDRGEALGEVAVPLGQISSASPKRRWEPLTRNNAAGGGELCFDCWVTSYRKPAPKWSFKPTGPTKEPPATRRSSVQMASVSLKGSRSMENLYSAYHSFDVINTLTLGMLKRSHSGILATDSTALQSEPGTERLQSLAVPGPQPHTHTPRQGQHAEVSLRVPEHAHTRSPLSGESGEAPDGGEPDREHAAPEITGLSPKFGAASGGTRITLRGRSLGTCRDDIVALSVCGCDLLPTLQFHSSSKLVCVTSPCSGSGPVVIETKTGGLAASTVNFSFKSDCNAQETAQSEQSDDTKRGKRGKVARSELLNEITRLRQEVLELSADNERLRKYIDRVLVAVMDKFPHLLENLTATL